MSEEKLSDALKKAARANAKMSESMATKDLPSQALASAQAAKLLTEASIEVELKGL